MPHYEFMTVATMAASASHLTAFFRSLTSLINSQGGVLRKIENLGLRPLAYRIRAHRKFNTVGRYIRFSVQANPQLMGSIEKALSNDEEIVRHLVVKRPVAPISDEFSPVEFDPKSIGKTSADVASVKERESSRSLVDFYAAKTLLSAGLISRDELARLPRHQPDANWDAQREKLVSTNSEAVRDEISELNARLSLDRVSMADRVAAESKLFAELEVSRKAALEAKLKSKAEFNQMENQRAIYRHWVYTLLALLKRTKKQMKPEFDGFQKAGKKKTDEEKRQLITERFRGEARTALKRFDESGIDAILSLTESEPNEITKLTGITRENFKRKKSNEVKPLKTAETK